MKQITIAGFESALKYSVAEIGAGLNVQSFELRTRGVFDSGFITFTREITALEKVQVMDALSNIFGGEVEGQRKGNVVLFWNPAKFSGVKKFERDACGWQAEFRAL